MDIVHFLNHARARWAQYVATAPEFIETQTNTVSVPGQLRHLLIVCPDNGARVRIVVDPGFDVSKQLQFFECKLHFDWGNLALLAPEKLVMYSKLNLLTQDEVFDDAAEHIHSFFLRLKRLKAPEIRKKA